MLTLFAAGLVAFFILNVVDWSLTSEILERGGREANPVLNAIMARTDRWPLVKMGLAVVVIVILARTGPSLWTWAAVGLLLAAWAYVVYHNAWVLGRMRKRQR